MRGSGTHLSTKPGVNLVVAQLLRRRAGGKLGGSVVATPPATGRGRGSASQRGRLRLVQDERGWCAATECGWRHARQRTHHCAPGALNLSGRSMTRRHLPQSAHSTHDSMAVEGEGSGPLLLLRGGKIWFPPVNFSTLAKRQLVPGPSTPTLQGPFFAPCRRRRLGKCMCRLGRGNVCVGDIGHGTKWGPTSQGGWWALCHRRQRGAVPGGRHLPRGFSCQVSVAADLCGVTAAGPGWRACCDGRKGRTRPRQRRARGRPPAGGGAAHSVPHAGSVPGSGRRVGQRHTHLPGWPRPRRRLTPRLRPLGVALTAPASRSAALAGVRAASGASPERTQPAGPTRASCGRRLPGRSVPTPCVAGRRQDALPGGAHLAGDAAVGGHFALEAVGGAGKA